MCFDYILLLALADILKFENRRSISIESLRNYRVKISSILKAYFESNLKSDTLINQDEFLNWLEENESIDRSKDTKLLVSFISKYSDYFYFIDNCIGIYDDVDVSDFESLLDLNNYNDVCVYLCVMQYNLELLKLLDIKQIPSEIKGWVLTVQSFYDFFGNFDDSFSKSTIKFGMSLICIRLKKLFFVSDELFNCYQNVLWEYNSDVNGEKNIRFFSNKLERDFNEELKDGYIDFFSNEMFFMALLSDNNLIYKFLDELMLNIYNLKNDESTEEFVEEIDVDELADDSYIKMFSSVYNELKNGDRSYFIMAICLIDAISKYQMSYGLNDELNTILQRLYFYCFSEENRIIDSNGLDLIKSVITNTEYDLEKEFKNIFIICRLFLIDILENSYLDDFTLNKVLLITAYYNFTHDQNIIDIIYDYRDSKMVSLIMAALNGNITPFLSKNKSYIKRLINPDNKE